MKVMQVCYQIVVSDESFEPGQCSKCPIKRVEGHENAMRIWEETTSCGIGSTPASCPVRPVKEN